MRNKKAQRQRLVRAEDIIAWIWEKDDPAAAACESQHLKVADQSVEACDLRVYDSLLTYEGEAASVDRTLANILVFADDCRTATEWLTSEVVSHDDEQARRAGQRRRHLKERGLLQNGKRFVRICDAVILDAEMIAVMAARQCIDDWEESAGERALHFKKCEGGVRWQPVTTDIGGTRTMHLSNPFTAPPTKPEGDGRTVEKYHVSFAEQEPPRAERSQWVSANEADIDDEEKATQPGWVLNNRAETTMDWLSEAAEIVADMAMDSEEQTLRGLFPSQREMKRLEEREAAHKRAAATKKQTPTEKPGTGGPGQSIH